MIAPRLLASALLGAVAMTAVGRPLRAEASPHGEAAAATVPAAAAPGQASPQASSIAAAILPGLILQGSGHYVAGDRATARKLFRVELLALAAIVAGGVPLAVSGGSRYFVLPGVPLLVGGTGLLVGNWFADLYGTLRGPRAAADEAHPPSTAELQRFRIGAHYSRVYDPQFAFRHLVGLRVGTSGRALRTEFIGELSTDGGAQRALARGVWALRGGLIDAHFGVRLDGGYLGQRGDGFAVSTIGALAGGRYEWSALGPSLQGAFTEVWLGVGLEVFDYTVAGAALDVYAAALAEFAVGAALPGGGEARLFYDHSRSDWAAGTATGGRGGGFFGSFGAEVRWPLSSGLTIAPRLQVGSAWVATLGLVVGLGGRP